MLQLLDSLNGSIQKTSHLGHQKMLNRLTNLTGILSLNYQNKLGYFHYLRSHTRHDTYVVPSSAKEITQNYIWDNYDNPSLIARARKKIWRRQSAMRTYSTAGTRDCCFTVIERPIGSSISDVSVVPREEQPTQTNIEMIISNHDLMLLYPDTLVTGVTILMVSASLLLFKQYT
ncbi:hypothetical protein PROFUN_16949, partial [Planoprotostelium fungivorum]